MLPSYDYEQNKNNAVFSILTTTEKQYLVAKKKAVSRINHT